eukprot:scpid89782/ scgid32265/ 
MDLSEEMTKAERHRMVNTNYGPGVGPARRFAKVLWWIFCSLISLWRLGAATASQLAMEDVKYEQTMSSGYSVSSVCKNGSIVCTLHDSNETACWKCDASTFSPRHLFPLVGSQDALGGVWLSHPGNDSAMLQRRITARTHSLRSSILFYHIPPMSATMFYSNDYGRTWYTDGVSEASTSISAGNDTFVAIPGAWIDHNETFTLQHKPFRISPTRKLQHKQGIGPA